MSQYLDESSGVGVIDKAARVLDCLCDGPLPLAALVTRTGLSRATAYRLAVALERHRLLTRDSGGRFAVGPRVVELAGAGVAEPWLESAPAVLAQLRDATGESAQLYRREGETRRCVAAAERASGLRDTVPVGAVLSLAAGSAAQVLLAWERPAEIGALLERARFGPGTLSGVRRRGWAASVAEREAGVASVSAPVWAGDGRIVAAVSVSGPIDRLTRTPGRRHAPAVVRAGQVLSGATAGRVASVGEPVRPHPPGPVRPAERWSSPGPDRAAGNGPEAEPRRRLNRAQRPQRPLVPADLGGDDRVRVPGGRPS